MPKETVPRDESPHGTDSPVEPGQAQESRREASQSPQIPRRSPSGSGRAIDSGSSASPYSAPHPSPAVRSVAVTNGRSHDGNGGNAMPLLSRAGVPIEEPQSPDEAARSSRVRRRLLLQANMVLLVVLLVADLLNLSPFADGTASQPPRQPSPIPLAEVQPFGVNTFLHKEVDPWKKKTTVEMASDMGVGWIKQQFPWAEIEFDKDSYWDTKNNQSAWDKFDNIVDLAQQYGLRIIARIDSTPAWARPTDAAYNNKLKQQGLDPAKAPPTAEHMEDFGQFIETFVTRYRGRVAAIQVWNEPNLRGEWATDHAVNPSEYLDMLKTAYTHAKAADPNIIVLAAPLATNNEQIGYAGNLNEIDYMQGLYDAGAKPYFDAMSANAYGTTYAPEDPPSRDKLNFRRVELLRAVMEKNGDSDKAVWFNEYGWNDSPDTMPADKLRWGRVTPEQQADYTVRGIEYAREHWPWAGVFTIWYLRQVGDIAPTESEYYFGLMSPDFVPSATYKAVQSAAQSYEKAATAGQWGPLSPAVEAPASWYTHLDPAVPGGVYVTPSAPGDTLTVHFVGTDVKVTLVPPAQAISGTDAVAARYYVTVDGQSSQSNPQLAHDDKGAYIDISPDGQPIDVTLVQGLGAEFRTSEHTLQIQVVAQSNGSGQNKSQAGGRTYAPLRQTMSLPGIGGVTVEVHRSYLLFAAVTALLVAGMLVIAWALWRSRPSAEAPARGR